MTESTSGYAPPIAPDGLGQPASWDAVSHVSRSLRG